MMVTPMQSRQARLFRNNRSQAVRIPADWEMPGDSVTIRRDGEKLVLEPVRARGLLGLLAAWDPLDETLPDLADPPPGAEDIL
ncbi:AbrB/MazE/SpoVT family DNA-binding domain-containing protein [Jannaschia sp.]|nr:AbrB/MazE/SpoVT family DNA-binding domain-containing protein [Jannaschia sp.]